MPDPGANDGVDSTTTAPFSIATALPNLASGGDLKGNWIKFRQLWDSYELLTGLNTKPDKIRIAMFIQAIGTDNLDIHNGLPYQEGDNEKMDKILQLWEEHAKGKVNIIYERYTFNTYVQNDETIEEFIQKCKQYGALRDELIRDRIVTDIKSRELKQKLLNLDENFSLDKCIKMCKNHETLQSQMKTMNEGTCCTSSSNVNFVIKPKYTNNCKFCGKKHELLKEKCPAYGKVCSNCQRPNHYSVKCTRPKSTHSRTKKPNERKHSKYKKRHSKSAHAVWQMMIQTVRHVQ